MTDPKSLAVPAAVAVLSGAVFYFSTGLAGTLAPGPGMLWAVALLAPVPVLWFAFQASRTWLVAVVAFVAYGLGAANLLSAYAGILPLLALGLAILAPAAGFAVAVAAARFVFQRVTPITAVFTFAFAWTGVDYLLSLGPNGAAASPAYAQLGLPWMVQIAAVFGLWGVTAVIGLIAAAIAMAIAAKSRIFAFLAVAVLALNLGYGAWRIETAPATPSFTVGLAADDRLVPLRFKADAASALTVANAYAAAGRALAGADLIVFPERAVVIRPQWRDAVNAPFEALARSAHAAVLIGADLRETPRSNSALMYFPNGAAPIPYAKRHLIPGLESVFEPGKKSFMTGDFIGVALCKDMDFPATLRSDALLAPTLYAVPAWDFDADGAWHARLAMMRGIENGFAVVRAANNGVLSISDAYGRVIAARKTGGGMVTLKAIVARGPGRTLYAGIGDGLAEIALAMTLLLVVVAVAAPKRAV
jgi:apolipoprotein N-acyltransferase